MFGNGTQAYLKAYPTPTVKNELTAKLNASRLLTIANIQRYIADLTASLDKERIMSVEEALTISSSIAKVDSQRFTAREYGTDGELSLEENKEFSAGMRERVQALEHIFKASAAFTETRNIKGELGVHVVVDYGDE